MSHRWWKAAPTMALLLLVGPYLAYHCYRYFLGVQLAAVLTPPLEVRIQGGAMVSYNLRRGAALVRQGADVNTRGYAGVTLLDAAARNGDHHLAEELIRKGADVNTRARGGITPLCGAAWRKDNRMIRLLLAHGANPNIPNLDTGWTPLFYLVVIRPSPKPNTPEILDCTQALLEAGADVAVTDRNGRTVLEDAVFAGETKMANLVRKAEPKFATGSGS